MADISEIYFILSSHGEKQNSTVTYISYGRPDI